MDRTATFRNCALEKETKYFRLKITITIHIEIYIYMCRAVFSG